MKKIFVLLAAALCAACADDLTEQVVVAPQDVSSKIVSTSDNAA
jgi:uncharacterized lipoprotein YajG